MRIRVTAVVWAAAISAAAAARADRTLDPPFGNVVYRAEIRTDASGPDADVFASKLLRGERLDLDVTVPFQSGLYPVLEVTGPGGRSATELVATRAGGRRAILRNFVVPETGTWSARVTAQFGSHGPYSMRVRVRPAPAASLRVPADAGGVASSADLAIEALDGARLDLRATSPRRGAPVLSSLTDPLGSDVPGAAGPAALAAVTRRRTLTLRVPSLAAGDGSYRARFDLPAGHTGLVASAVVTPAGRGRGSRKLSAYEPFLDARTFVLRGSPLVTVRLTGRNFTSDPAPTVLFGDVPGRAVTVESAGTALTVTPPDVPAGVPVRVAVVNPDGQVHERADYYVAVAQPTLSDVRDASDAPVAGASSLGGRVLRMFGTNFISGIWFRIGPSTEILPTRYLDAGTVEVLLPPLVPGSYPVLVQDAYGHEAATPFEIEIKVPPSFGAVPYAPASPLGDGTAYVAISGAGMDVDDVVLFDGAPVTTVFQDAGHLQFAVPASAAGTHTVSIRDRVGTVVAGPAIVVR